ncbi:MAG: hypothetical protein UT39_C0009G0065 [Candidatus Woesebacteria bacterium GW2011_GWA1_39_21]|uniref:Uncharacterized protein n=1 Tax=Candidatus Woesebacteria bacterium GW2011_GWA1_39_21 TaxID=1618550 RepID=A0A0G0QLN6_9BACT|nr:MAG: hypothetical protein UT39_C0009G0065 [Candidatus Woesebacteria bacterium GW2011_GWA1_39_21]
MKKEYLIIFIVLLVAIVGFFFLKGNKSDNEDVTQEPQVVENGRENNTVTYSDSGFVPDSLVVAVGTTALSLLPKPVLITITTTCFQPAQG